MKFISSPIAYEETTSRLILVRDLHNKKGVLNKLIEMIVFTPKGSFVADPDFGFEYWNLEYSNFKLEDFNLDKTGCNGNNDESDKKRCLQSIKDSLSAYAPWLTDIKFDMSLGANEHKNPKQYGDSQSQAHRGVHSRLSVTITIKGEIYASLGTTEPYDYEVRFLVDPTVKR